MLEAETKHLKRQSVEWHIIKALQIGRTKRIHEYSQLKGYFCAQNYITVKLKGNKWNVMMVVMRTCLYSDIFCFILMLQLLQEAP